MVEVDVVETGLGLKGDSRPSWVFVIVPTGGGEERVTA